MNKYEAIIFDMDGVLIDSEPHHEAAFLQVCEEIGYGQTHGIIFSDYYGRSDVALWEDFVARHQPQPPLEDLIEWKRNCFYTLIEAAQPIFPDVPPLLEKLQGRYKLALASGSDHPVIDIVLKMQNLRQYFGAVVSSSDVTHGKPAPDIFLRAAQLLDVAPEKCCVVEDATSGVAAARAAGMDVIAICNSLPPEKFSSATHIVHDYHEVERLLLQ